MPPTSVHFNGSVNLADAETVMRQIAGRVPSGVRRIPDGETGDRQQWIFFQLQKFWDTPGLEDAGASDQPEGYTQMPQVRLAEGVDPDEVTWRDLGYANSYEASFTTFESLQAAGVIAADVRFQVEYPTPLAAISAWIVPADQDRLEGPYERALFADLDRLMAAVPHDQVAVQWDVAVEITLLEGALEGTDGHSFDSIVQRLARCIDRVPEDVPVGLHLCYGDYEHRHVMEPESLALQVRLANELRSAARKLDWLSFTVPQYQRQTAFFAPLQELNVAPETELYFALVPYHPDVQEPGTTDEQVRLVDAHLPTDQGDSVRQWGVCTECGMGRVEQEDIPHLLDLHREMISRGR